TQGIPDITNDVVDPPVQPLVARKFLDQHLVADRALCREPGIRCVDAARDHIRFDHFAMRGQLRFKVSLKLCTAKHVHDTNKRRAESTHVASYFKLSSKREMMLTIRRQWSASSANCRRPDRVMAKNLAFRLFSETPHSDLIHPRCSSRTR